MHFFKIKTSLVFVATFLTLGVTATCSPAHRLAYDTTEASNQIDRAYEDDILVVISFKGERLRYFLSPSPNPQTDFFHAVHPLRRENFTIDILLQGIAICNWDPLQPKAMKHGLQTGFISEDLIAKINLIRFFSIENLICCKIKFVGDYEEKFYFVGVTATCSPAHRLEDGTTEASNQIDRAYEDDILVVISFKGKRLRYSLSPFPNSQTDFFQEVHPLRRENFTIDILHQGIAICNWDPLQPKAMKHRLQTGFISEDLIAKINLIRFFSTENLICCKIKFAGDDEEKFYFVGTFLMESDYPVESLA